MIVCTRDVTADKQLTHDDLHLPYKKHRIVKSIKVTSSKGRVAKKSWRKRRSGPPWRFRYMHRVHHAVFKTRLNKSAVRPFCNIIMMINRIM